MKTKLKPILIITLWMVLGFYIYNTGILSSKESIIEFLSGINSIEGYAYFIGISVLRILLFIPQTVLILGGSLLFGPITGTILSVVGLFLSQSIMYFVGRCFGENSIVQQCISNDQKYLNLIKNYGYKILSMGIICPIAPSDIIVLLTGYLRFNYIKTMVVIVLSDFPMILLYSLTVGLTSSFIAKGISLLSIVIVSAYGIYVFTKLHREHTLGGEVSDKIY